MQLPREARPEFLDLGTAAGPGSSGPLCGGRSGRGSGHRLSTCEDPAVHSGGAQIHTLVPRPTDAPGPTPLGYQALRGTGWATGLRHQSCPRRHSLRGPPCAPRRAGGRGPALSVAAFPGCEPAALFPRAQAPTLAVHTPSRKAPRVLRNMDLMSRSIFPVRKNRRCWRVDPAMWLLSEAPGARPLR